MKAVMCTRFGGPELLALSNVDDPVAGEGQAVIDIKACAVNFPDVLMLHDRYQFKPQLPFSPGGEVAGLVRSVGPGVKGVAVGDRVIASTTIGGLAEQVASPADSLTPIPEGVDFVEASGLLYAYGTAHHALKDRARLQPGETLVVLGAAGGVGLAAVDLGRLMGARVIAAASSEAKLELCRRHGADATINYETQDLKVAIRELTDDTGADVVYDPVGGPYAEPAVRATAWDGRYLVIGFAAGEIPRIPLNLPLLRGCSVVGVFWGAFARRDPAAHRRSLEELGAWWRTGQIRPYVSATYPLEQAGDAIAELAERRATGKVVVTVG
ncbi:MAG: NADPH:quinone oxidoreductase family protein [Acidimicrobiaceae bacterium]|nr:NADPH:quinone oxidoreductase family protein [Acidimicrobiaceae bacterium]